VVVDPRGLLLAGVVVAADIAEQGGARVLLAA
jgi:hypothetical protein